MYTGRKRQETEAINVKMMQLHNGDRLILQDPEEDVAMEIQVEATAQIEDTQYILGTTIAEEDLESMWPEDEEADTEAFILKVCDETDALFWVKKQESTTLTNNEEFAVTTDFGKNELKKAVKILMAAADYDLEMEEDE